MKAYVVTANNRPVQVCWSKQQAERELAFVQQVIREAEINSVPVANLVGVVMEYFAFRGYKAPDPTQAFLFLTSEVGELADRMVQA